MTDIKLNSEGDLDLTGHRLNLTDDEESIEQQCRIRCQFFLGEWFLNQNEGIPYFRDILIKAPSEALIRNHFKQAISTVPGIAEVTNISFSLDKKTREATIGFSARMDTGEELIFEPFVIAI